MEIQEWISKDQWCLYKHTSPSGKVYVGITNNTVSRWRNGIGYKTQCVFWRAIQKYGWENFTHEIIETGLPLEVAKQKEIMLIEQLKSTNSKFGYNMTKGGDSIPMSFHTEESIEKALATKRAKLAAGIHQANYGRKASPELRKKLSDAHKGLQVGSNHPMYGKHLTDEQKQHLRDINTGKKHAEEEKIKTSRSCAGKCAGEKHGMYGTKHSEEHRKHISESLRNNPTYTTKKIPIMQCDLYGEIIKIWPSLTAIRKELRHDGKCITDCCKGKRETFCGYIWRYLCPELSIRNPPACNTPPSLSNK